MIRNYLKTAFRSLKRNTAYTLINISGLAIGMAAALIIFLVIRYELSYNTAQPHYKNIYHVATKDNNGDGITYTPGVPYPLLEALRSDFPQAKTGAIFSTYGTQVNVPEPGNAIGKKFIENNGMFFADDNFFDVFSFDWLAGNASLLREPNSIVLTKSIAEKYFGDWKSAIGKTIRIDNAMDMKVTGILDDLPGNTDFPITLLGSFATIKNNRYYGYSDEWGGITSNFQVFMLLPANVKADAIENQLEQLATKYYKNEGANKRVNVLRPLSKVHFDPDVPAFGDHLSSEETLLTLAMIGFMIILMACINFINLSTAQAVTRSKEVGVRKVLGSNRKQLFLQVMSETSLVVILSAVLSLILAKLSMPHIKHIVSINEELSLFTPQSILFFALTIIAVTFLSGIYPALILSGFKPVTALKNKISSASVGGISLRRGLVVTQFCISQILIVGTIVAINQMDFIRTADLGFNKDAVLFLNSSSDSAVRVRQKPFKEYLLGMPGVKMVSLSSDVPSSNHHAGTNFAYDHKNDENFTLYFKAGDEDYFKTYGLEFVAGGPYTTSDTSGKVVVNETLLKKLNIKNPQDAVGKDIRTGGSKWRMIAGVVKDFKTNSLKEEINPLMIAPSKKRFSVISVKLHSGNLANSKLAIQKAWDKFFPEYAFDGTFVDESIQEFYKQDEQLTLLYKIFAGLAVFISCLGLYGLVSFMVVQKTKEVGIRKVLGAGIVNIIYLFSKEFTLLIGIAFIIAAPLAWYFMTNWLQNFVYRTSIGFNVFIYAILISVVIAWVTVGYKALRAALTNPIKSLRTE